MSQTSLGPSLFFNVCLYSDDSWLYSHRPGDRPVDATSKEVLEAYGVGTSLGSLAGILLFTFLSYCQSPPVLWFAVATAAMIWILMKTPRFMDGVISFL